MGDTAYVSKEKMTSNNEHDANLLSVDTLNQTCMIFLCIAVFIKFSFNLVASSEDSSSWMGGM